jgi:hypothetical protein
MKYKLSIPYHHLYVIATLAVVISACSTELTEPKYSQGDADITKYIALGGGYSAGYADNALHLDNQKMSFPTIIANRFSTAGGGDFTQPLVNSGNGLGLDNNAKLKLQLVSSSCNDPYVNAVAVDTIGDLSNTAWIGAAVRYQNMSVPGARITDLNKQQFGDPSPFVGNIFYARFAINPGQSTVIGDALVQSPTFYTAWIGMEDIYGFAVGGGNQGNDSITDISVFEDDLTNLLSSFTSIGAKGAIATIPEINTIPFFAAIPWNGLILDASKAQSLTAAYAGINPNITFQEGANGFVVSDATEPSGLRQLISGELVLFTNAIDSIICAGLGSTVPIPASKYLDMQEVTTINNAIASYNNIIRTLATDNELAVADMVTLFRSFGNGIQFGGANYTNGYIYDSVFSSDGLFPNPRGNAFIANAFIRAINETFGAKIPEADVNSYPANIIP